MRNKAWRRQQDARAHKKATERSKLAGSYNWLVDHNKLERWVGKSATTPHPCSCHMCGNPRKHYGEKPVKERRALQESLRDYPVDRSC